MRVAYADPPYIGQARKHYSGDVKCAEVNHRILIGTLVRDYDAFALSASSPSLPAILQYCPSDVRIMAWVKPFCSFKPGVGVAYAWEPVIVWGGRKRTRGQITVRDFVSANITLRRGLAGAKPDAFCFWLFDVLNMNPTDDFHDIFPGSGAVTAAWERWQRQHVFDFSAKEAAV